VLDPAAVPRPEGGDWLGAGSGWDRYAPPLTARLAGRLRGWLAGAQPQARDVAVLAADAFARGAAVSAELALPTYIRDDVAAKRR
jgi:tRNA threonylcarbamoyladenosine biosynthesis protein TsaB